MGSASPPRVLVVDNYDSFTFNLVQYLTAAGAACTVVENDRATVSELRALTPDGLVISPGPGAPESAGVSISLIRALAGVVPILGVCLGHQAIAQAFGARVSRSGAPVHGKVSRITHDGRGALRGLPSPFAATRYHSLLVEPNSVPDVLEISARTSAGEIMGLRHRQLAIEGLQFHPESILTEHGPQLVQNWLSLL